MFATSRIRHCGAVAAAAAALVCAAAPTPHVVPDLSSARPATRLEDDDGRDAREPVSRRPTVEAAFDAESYRPRTTARLVLFDSAPTASIQIFRVGDSAGMLTSRDVMRGDAVAAAASIGRVTKGRVVSLRLGNWPSALYYAQLTAPGGRVGYAPFVLRPARLGTHRIGVVLPTQTWQAYNFRDDDGDGSADTWYTGPTKSTARLHRPFENRGTPPHYHHYDEPYLRWLARNRWDVDVLSDADLNAADGDELARAYNLLVFPGHHEYVTTHEFDAVRRYRDRGGNLMFLSANNFYWQITIRGDVMTRMRHWRELGRPEAALIGVQYYGYDMGQHRGPWTLRRAAATRWIFRGTRLGPGSAFSNGGIEADSVASASPPGVQVVAEIRSLFGDGRNAQMSYYETPRGAKVFAAGAFTLAGAVWQPPVRRVMTNLLQRLSRP